MKRNNILLISLMMMTFACRSFKIEKVTSDNGYIISKISRYPSKAKKEEYYKVYVNDTLVKSGHLKYSKISHLGLAESGRIVEYKSGKKVSVTKIRRGGQAKIKEFE